MGSRTRDGANVCGSISLRPPQVNDRGAGRGPLSSAGAVVMIAGTGARKRNIPCDNQKTAVLCSRSVGSGIDVPASEERRCVKFYNFDILLMIGGHRGYRFFVGIAV